MTTNVRLLVPLAAVGAGAFIAWYQIDERQGRHWSSRTVWERIAWRQIPRIGVALELRVPQQSLDLGWRERWVAEHVIGRIPGGRHDPE